MSQGRCVFEYREPWQAIVALAVLGTISTALGFHRVVAGYPFIVALATQLSIWALLVIGLIMLALAGWVAVDRLRCRRVVEVSETAITVPRSRWSARRVTVPLEDLSAVWTTEWMGTRRLHLDWAERRFVVAAAMLPSPDQFDRLVSLLRSRLGPLGVPVEIAPPPRRFRPQFSVAWMLVAVTVVAAALGVHSYVNGRISWDAAVEVAFALVITLLVPWLVLAAPWHARVFAVGFVAGYWVETGATLLWVQMDWVQFRAGSAVPENWYPLSFAVQRIVHGHPALDWLAVAYRVGVVGGVLSGCLVGAAALGAWYAVVRTLGRHGRQKRVGD